MWSVDEAPQDLAIAIKEFWPADDWDAAASIAFLESGWDAFATRDTRDSQHPCGSILWSVDGVPVSAEWSIGYFQINACNIPPNWNPAHLYNARHNAGTAHDYWSHRGWEPWYFSARTLGLL